MNIFTKHNHVFYAVNEQKYQVNVNVSNIRNIALHISSNLMDVTREFLQFLPN